MKAGFGSGRTARSVVDERLGGLLRKRSPRSLNQAASASVMTAWILCKALRSEALSRSEFSGGSVRGLSPFD